ncbi:MAG: hypothetical protein AB7I30_21725, partial [Isosphaeraceae bacterium]
RRSAGGRRAPAFSSLMAGWAEGMARTLTRVDAGTEPADGRPIAFLVSTTTSASGIAQKLGLAAYSYYFAVEALAPVLEAFGTWRLVEHPESRLAFAAARAEAEGFRPVHLSVNPLQDAYLSPALPNVLFPFWEFPDVPERDFGFDTRQNWRRVGRSADLILTACQFTARTFRRSGIETPVAVVPVPLDPEAFALPPWSSSHSWTLACRHEVLGPERGSDAGPGPEVPRAVDETNPTDLGGRAWSAARAGFRRVAPRLNPHLVAHLTRLKRGVAKAVRHRPDELVYVALRDGYRNHVRRWLNPEALDRISAAKRKALALVGREPVVVPDPPLPSADLTLGGDGPVYLTVFNLGDLRKNYRDVLTAFLLAFADRPDATLVVKLVTNPLREHHEVGVLRAAYRELGIDHACRIVVITEFLSEAQMTELFRVTTYYVNASHAEGACLPLMRALAGGRPAIAPVHTAMADYMSAELGFVLRSSPEPAFWPHDPERRLETFRERIVWSDLHAAFLDSAAVADHDRPRYDAMASAARSRLAELASRPAAAQALRDALAQLPS